MRLNLNTEVDDSCSSRLRKAYVAASSPAFLNHCQGAPKRSGGGLVVVLVLDLLGFWGREEVRCFRNYSVLSLCRGDIHAFEKHDSPTSESGLIVPMVTRAPVKKRYAQLRNQWKRL